MDMNGARGELIITVNAGSSSIKTGLFVGHHGQPAVTLLARGKLDGIGTRPRLRINLADGTVLNDASYEVAQAADLETGFQLMHGAVSSGLRGRIPALVGHRVVHGGSRFTVPTRIDPAVMEQLRGLEPLAPLHQPHNLAVIQSILDNDAALPQVACFDTAFHANRSELSQLFGLPYGMYEQGIRRYGFHGLSFEYISQHLAERAPEAAAGKVVIAHLGNGSSLCAVDNGKSVDVSTSFSALDGVPMGSRCGALDPGVVLHLLSQGADIKSLEDLLYRQSGLLGISGVSSDMRSLRASAEPRARLAIDYYAYRISQEIGRLAVSLGGLDALVFTAGIGEKDSALRSRIVGHLAPLFGLAVDEEANQRHAVNIAGPASAAPLYVIATDEESMIAGHAWRLYQEQSP